MSQSQACLDSCEYLLSKWRGKLNLTNKERGLLAEEITTFDNQLERLSNREFNIAVFGRVGVGKSSLLNALIGQKVFHTDIAHGSTKNTQKVLWEKPLKTINSIQLIDTPGIDEIAGKGKKQLASNVAFLSDLILLVLDSDISRLELEALENLLRKNKPIILVLNRSDQWSFKQRMELIAKIKNRLPKKNQNIIIEVAASAPREPHLLPDGRIRSEIRPPEINQLLATLSDIIDNQGRTLLALNSLNQADYLFQSLSKKRLTHKKKVAQALIGKFATIKASGVAINPLLVFDFAAGLTLDTALIIQLAKLYGLELRGHSAREILKTISLHNSWLGGAQIGINFFLGALQHLLLIASPFTGGVTLAPAGPVALVQAVLAVHTTQITGRLAAQTFLNGSSIRGTQPKLFLEYLLKKDPQLRKWIDNYSTQIHRTDSTHTFLP